MKTSWVQLEQKLKGEEKMEIKEKLARLDRKIKGLERSFRETLETLTGTEENVRERSREREHFERIETQPKEERGFLGKKRGDWTKPPKNDSIGNKKTFAKRESLGFRNNYLKSRENKPQILVKADSQDWRAVTREPQEVYRDYLAESKMK